MMSWILLVYDIVFTSVMIGILILFILWLRGFREEMEKESGS